MKYEKKSKPDLKAKAAHCKIGWVYHCEANNCDYLCLGSGGDKQFAILNEGGMGRLVPQENFGYLDLVVLGEAKVSVI